METHDKQRRIMLRRTLFTMCALTVPTLLTTGCDKNEDHNNPTGGDKTNTPKADEGGTQMGATNTQGGAKVSKQAAKYQESPNGDQRCSKCAYFLANSNTCERVEGKVSPDGWCALWTKKT